MDGVAASSREPSEDLLAQAEAVERTDPAESLRLALSVLASRASPPSGRDRFRALFQAGRCAYFQRDLERSLQYAMDAERELRRAEATPLERARVVDLLGTLFSAYGHDEAALESFEQAIAGSAVDRAEHARIRANRAGALRRMGRLDAAAEAFGALLDGGLEDPRTHVSVHLNAASCFWQTGDFDRARRCLESAGAVQREHGVVGFEPWQEALTAWVALGSGSLDEAYTAARRAVAVAEAGADQDAVISATRSLAHVGIKLGGALPDGSSPRPLLEELLATARERGWLADVAQLCLDLADLHEAAGELPGAVAWLREAAKAERANQRARLGRREYVEEMRLELRRLTRETEQLRTHNERLRELNDRLTASSAQRAHLLATLSHDLRSPLTALQTTVELARGGGDQDEILDIFDAATIKLLAMIDGVVNDDALRQRVGLAEARETDVVRIVDEALLERRAAAEQKSIQLIGRLPGELEALTEPVSLRRVVDNLLSNAIKFGPPGSRVVVALDADGDDLGLSVRDHGPGFTDADFGRLFRLGATASAQPTAGESSSGIGLYVVRTLVDALGGHVRAANADGSGALLEVRLPRFPKLA